MEDPDYVEVVKRLGYCEADLALLHPKKYPVEKLSIKLQEAWKQEREKTLARPPTPIPDEPSMEPADSAWNPAAPTPEPPAMITWEGKCESLASYSRLNLTK